MDPIVAGDDDRRVYGIVTREPQRERRAGADFRGERQTAALRFGDLAGDRETEAAGGSFTVAAIGLVAPAPVAAEDERMVRGVDAGALIGDGGIGPVFACPR